MGVQTNGKRSRGEVVRIAVEGETGARGSARHNEPLPQPLEVHYRLFLTFS